MCLYSCNSLGAGAKKKKNVLPFVLFCEIDGSWNEDSTPPYETLSFVQIIDI